MPRRVGDSPILGGGTYADNDSGCVPSTDSGETIMSYNVATRILALIRIIGLSAQEATVKVLDEMTERFKQNLGIYFTTRRMSLANQCGGELHFGVDMSVYNVEIVGEPR